MRRKFIIITVISFMASLGIFGQTQLTAGSLDSADRDEAEIDLALMGVTGPTAPFLSGDYVVFTADSNARYVGLAFDFENYRHIHKYELKTNYDEEYNVASKFYVYVLKLPKDVQSFNYRMVIDGLWTTDPVNPEKNYSPEAQLIVSHVNARREIVRITENVPAGKVRFIYKGKSGQKVRLGGSFTNWDSWIYELTEVQPGLYMLDLPLPPGTYEYAYYIGMNSYVDTSNPQRVWSADGKAASQITVN